MSGEDNHFTQSISEPTPEPWDVSVWDRHVFVAGGPNNDDIAEFNFCDEATVKITKEEAIANARLFASAPALKREAEHWKCLQAIAATGTAENFLALSDEDKRQFFAIAFDESSRRKAAELELAALRADLDAKPSSPAPTVDAIIEANKIAETYRARWLSCLTHGEAVRAVDGIEEPQGITEYHAGFEDARRKIRAKLLSYASPPERPSPAQKDETR